MVVSIGTGNERDADRIRTSSLPSTPMSGMNRIHPYAPAREVSADTSCEVVSSLPTQAPAALGTDNGMKEASIAKSFFSPALSTPIRVRARVGRQA